LEKTPALTPGKRNELDPPALVMSAEAKALWISFHDHVERQRRGNLEHIRDFAAKAPEHAARIAGVITLVENIYATEIGATAMTGAVTLADWYVGSSPSKQAEVRYWIKADAQAAKKFVARFRPLAIQPIKPPQKSTSSPKNTARKKPQSRV
jgi:hypothetical protein